MAGWQGIKYTDQECGGKIVGIKIAIERLLIKRKKKEISFDLGSETDK